jgi:hypothetical protein
MTHVLARMIIAVLALLALPVAPFAAEETPILAV